MASEKETEASLTHGKEEPPPSYQSTNGTDHTVDMPNEPPPYGDTQNEPLSEAPPSYDSLFGKVKAAKASSPNQAHFARSVVLIVMGTVGCTIVLGLMLAVPISMTVIGGIYMHDCPAERYIPIYLVVAGAFGIVENLSSLIQKLRKKKDEEEDQQKISTPCDMLINCFLFAWFIAGNVWIYRTYGNWSSDELAPNYCHPTLYYFAFWLMTFSYIIVALICACTCVGGVIAACLK